MFATGGWNHIIFEDRKEKKWSLYINNFFFKGVYFITAVARGLGFGFFIMYLYLNEIVGMKRGRSSSLQR